MGKDAIYVPDRASEAFHSITEERQRQEDKWGEQNHDAFIWLGILMEEVGEAAQEALTEKFGAAGNGHGNLREEVVQIAAVAAAWIECIDRGEESLTDAQRLALELIESGLFERTLSDSVSEASSHEKARMIARAGIEGQIERLQNMKSALEALGG